MSTSSPIARVDPDSLKDQIEVFDTTNTEFLKRVLPLRQILTRLGYNQPDDHILFSPFDTISRHFLLVDEAGKIQGAISAIDATHAKSEVLGTFGVEFDPGKTIMLARFAIDPNVSKGRLSLTGPRLLSSVFKKLADEGYDYVIGEMSPPYQTPGDTDSQGGVVHHHLRIKNAMLVSAYAYRDRVPTMVTGIPLSDNGIQAQQEWAQASERRPVLAKIEQVMRTGGAAERRHGWNMVHGITQ